MVGSEGASSLILHGGQQQGSSEPNIAWWASVRQQRAQSCVVGSEAAVILKLHGGQRDSSGLELRGKCWQLGRSELELSIGSELELRRLRGNRQQEMREQRGIS